MRFCGCGSRDRRQRGSDGRAGRPRGGRPQTAGPRGAVKGGTGDRGEGTASYLRWLARIGPDFIWTGLFLEESHGYPPETPGVAGVLYAWGSGIARGLAVSTVNAIDIHPTVTHLLGIEPGRPVDGSVATSLLR